VALADIEQRPVFLFLEEPITRLRLAELDQIRYLAPSQVLLVEEALI
jgi:hypothetical protein